VRLTILSYQRHRNPSLEACEEDYIQRLRRYAEFELCAVRKWNAAAGVPDRFGNGCYRIGLCVDGRQRDSAGCAARVRELLNLGHAHLVFIVGAAEGMPAGVEPQLHERWSLSPLTFSHQLTRLILLEVLYRSFDLLHGGRYHK
jgi:23S rRNA (pseudouridine1915-N3)-methyltransferase